MISLKSLWRRVVRTGEPIRGVVNRVSVIKGGERSVVIRFGLDEPDIDQLKPGTLIAVVPEGWREPAVPKRRRLDAELPPPVQSEETPTRLGTA